MPAYNAERTIERTWRDVIAHEVVDEVIVADTGSRDNTRIIAEGYGARVVDVPWEDDFSAAVGNAVSAGWDTDCNGATVGGLFGLTGKPIPESWTLPWQGRVGVGLAGYSELSLDDLVDRTVAVAEQRRIVPAGRQLA